MYDPDIDVIIDLKNLSTVDKATFIAELAKNGVTEGGPVKLLNK